MKTTIKILHEKSKLLRTGDGSQAKAQNKRKKRVYPGKFDLLEEDKDTHCNGEDEAGQKVIDESG